MQMIKIIEWCNENAGVIAAAQTLATIILSIIAVVVSVHFSKLQYKREMNIFTFLDYDNKGTYKLDLYFYNCGNVPINITGIQVVREYKKKTKDILSLGCCNPEDMECKGFLTPKMHDSCSIILQNCSADIEETGTRIKIIVQSHENEFVKRISWAVG